MHRLVLVLALTAAAVISASVMAEEVDSKSDAIKFGGITAKPVKLSLGKQLRFDAAFKTIEVGNTTAVSVAGELRNPTDHKLYYSYQVAFLDKDKNLVGCQNFSNFVEAGKAAHAGTFISLPASQIEKIASYSVIFYESDKPIGTR